jgi:hypothetical protein
VFIRRKPGRGGAVSYAVVEAYREGQAVRQRHVASLGAHPTIAQALAALDHEDAKDRERIEEIRARIANRRKKRRQLRQLEWMPR